VNLNFQLKVDNVYDDFVTTAYSPSSPKLKINKQTEFFLNLMLIVI
jgi:hypothetical protein